jgi:hypothetical protein
MVQAWEKNFPEDTNGNLHENGLRNYFEPENGSL